MCCSICVSARKVPAVRWKRVRNPPDAVAAVKAAAAGMLSWDQPPPPPSPLFIWLAPPPGLDDCSPHDNIRFWDIAEEGGRLALVEKSIYSEEYQRLCTVLRSLRLEAGLTQVQVAAKLDVPQSFVSKYESGERRLDVVELGHVAQALGTTTRDVLRKLAEVGG
jgi:DNA-binding XRE family transcriptional regulator